MFDELDDPQGVPLDATRPERVERRARQLRSRRRLAGAVAAVVGLAVPGAAFFATSEPGGVDVTTVAGEAGDRERPDTPTTTVGPEPERSPAPDPTVPVVDPPVPPLMEAPPTTIPLPPSTTPPAIEAPTTTTTVAPPTTTTTTATTAPPPPDDVVAVLIPTFESGVTGLAGARQVGTTTWRISVRAEHLVPGYEHDVLVTDSSGGDAATLCEFTSREDGNGSCDGPYEPALGAGPARVSVMGYHPSSGGFRVVADGLFSAP